MNESKIFIFTTIKKSKSLIFMPSCKMTGLGKEADSNLIVTTEKFDGSTFSSERKDFEIFVQIKNIEAWGVSCYQRTPSMAYSNKTMHTYCASDRQVIVISKSGFYIFDGCIEALRRVLQKYYKDKEKSAEYVIKTINYEQ